MVHFYFDSFIPLKKKTSKVVECITVGSQEEGVESKFLSVWIFHVLHGFPPGALTLAHSPKLCTQS